MPEPRTVRPGRRTGFESGPGVRLTARRPGIRRHSQSSGADIPAEGRPGCPRRPSPEHLPGGGQTLCCGFRRRSPSATATADPDQLATWIERAKDALGDRLIILGHHYQRDEVMRWADARGDSFGLSRLAAEQTRAEFVVFCGVHFMAESADILTGPHQQVILPDLNAGCSMADMADIDSVEEAWDVLATRDRHRSGRSRDLHELLGRPQGLRRPTRRRRVHLVQCPRRTALGPGRRRPGRSAATRFSSSPTSISAATPASSSALPPRTWSSGTHGSIAVGSTTATLKTATLLLWKGHCSVHQRFRPEHVDAFRQEHPEGIVIAHPECAHEVVELADQVGSTDFIIRAVAEAPSGSVIGVGTEIHLVKRLDDETPDKTVVSLDPLICPCSTMFRVDAAHLAWVLEGLVEGEVRNRITVDEETARWARVALERMLATV